IPYRRTLYTPQFAPFASIPNNKDNNISFLNTPASHTSCSIFPQINVYDPLTFTSLASPSVNSCSIRIEDYSSSKDKWYSYLDFSSLK
ncbi:14894_t:CDS:2, partial [Racocetra persica]